MQISCVAKAAGKAAGQVIGEGDGLSLRYDAFGDIGTIRKELKWKMPIVPGERCRKLQTRRGSAAPNLTFTGLTQKSWSTLTVSYSDSQSNCWVNLRILGSTL